MGGAPMLLGSLQGFVETNGGFGDRPGSHWAAADVHEIGLLAVLTLLSPAWLLSPLHLLLPLLLLLLLHVVTPLPFYRPYPLPFLMSLLVVCRAVCTYTPILPPPCSAVLWRLGPLAKVFSVYILSQ